MPWSAGALVARPCGWLSYIRSVNLEQPVMKIPLIAATACALTVLAAAGAAAQNPDLVLTQAERDSILANYHQVFPLLGRQAIAKGFLLPLPVGLNVNSVYINQGIALSQLHLSTGNNPLQPVSFITLGEATSRVFTTNARADLWVLPFLNVYGMAGQAWAETTVPVTSPVAFTSTVSQTGNYAGVGLTGMMGVKRNWLAVDVNWTWIKLEKLINAVQGRVLGFRWGRTIETGPRSRANFWIGTQNQRIATNTQGSIAISDALPPDVIDTLQSRLANYQNQSWYQNLGPAQKVLADSLVSAIANSGIGSTTINYQLGKKPADPWNMIVGGSYEPTRHWAFRGEVGFIGRFQVLLVANYRFGL